MHKMFFYVLLAASLSATGCEHSTKGLDSCKIHLINSKKAVNLFYQKRDTTLLSKGLAAVDSAFSCTETRLAAVDTKIVLLSLLHRYIEGCNFIGTLKEEDFRLPYKKEMDYDYFKGQYYFSRRDTINSKLFFYKSYLAVKSYLDQHGNAPQKEEDQEPYLDLFVAAKNCRTPGEIEDELTLLKRKYPDYGNFWEMMEASGSNPHVVSADGHRISQ